MTNLQSFSTLFLHFSTFVKGYPVSRGGDTYVIRATLKKSLFIEICCCQEPKLKQTQD